MPISDLLASITGEKPKPLASTTTVTRTPAPSLKRKAEDDLAGSCQRAAQRTVPIPSGSSKPDGSAAKTSHSTERPVHHGSASIAKVSSTSRTVPNKPPTSSQVKKPSRTPSKEVPSGSDGNKARGQSSTLVKRSSPSTAAKTGTSTGDAFSKGLPKKGSYAEIMARASRAQATMGPIGKIQHKAIEKLPSKREREDLRAEQARTMKRGVKPGLSAVSGRHVRNGNGPSNEREPNQRRNVADRYGNVKRSESAGKGLKAPPDEERKLKKAALATTGYTGTARPSAPKSALLRSGAANGRRGERDGRPYGAFSARRSRNDEYDPEMDDFIDDDEEQDQPEGTAYGYRYASEEDSDMEAGLSEIDIEERRAEYVAKQEDAAEEALEKQLKREKEERKRRLLEARAGRR